MFSFDCKCMQLCRILYKMCYLLMSTEFQNYLRTQAGNTTTVNIIICTVDYLLRLQVSMKQLKVYM